MFTLDGMKKLHAWTHACIDPLLEHLSGLPDGDYGKEVHGFGFPTLCQQAIHIFNCEGFWIHTLQGRSYINYEPAKCPHISDAKLVQRQVQEWTHTYFSTLTEQQLNSNTELHFPEGDMAVRTPALVRHHVLTHAFHHKGQMVAMCRELGHPAPDTHVIQFQ